MRKIKKTAPKRPLPSDYGFIEPDDASGYWPNAAAEYAFSVALQNFEKAQQAAKKPHFAHRNPNIRFWLKRQKRMIPAAALADLAGKGIFGLKDDDVPMLSTGLTDVNGREVFEGDYVKWGHLPGSEESTVRTAIVEFAPDLQFRVVGRARLAFGYGIDYIFRFGKWPYRARAAETLEITGNFYEGPHPD